MDRKKSIITLKDYLAKSKIFKIPDYQRGYVWGKKRKVNNKQDRDSVTYMMESLYEGYVAYIPIFIQGVTVYEERDYITVIDGQQRTTFFYLLLCYLQYNEKFELEYEVRKESKEFLKNIKGKSVEEIKSLCVKDEKDLFQDIYFFKKTIRIIAKCLDKWAVDTIKLKDYLLANIQFLYIDIPEEKARTVFAMMNGNRASMTDEDLIKAEILRMISLDEDDTEIVRREQDLLRSRYAREWDRWVRWWNQGKIQKFYKLNYFYKSDKDKHPLAALLSTYYHSLTQDGAQEDFNFENFRTHLLLSKADAYQTFVNLRHLQKKFEDVYNDIDCESHRHNTVGGILTVVSRKFAVEFMYDYFTRSMHPDELDKVFKSAFMGNLTYKETMGIGNQDESTIEKLENAKSFLYQAISNDDIYNNPDYKEIAFRQLLLLNIEYDSQLGRMFNFSAYDNRSIEHIFPKSKVYKMNNNGQTISCEDNKLVSIDENWINKEDLSKNNCSQHSIGNFALLYTFNNSKLGNKTFEEKKKILFGTNNDVVVDVFQSRELLHTVSLFSFEKWGVKEIANNKKNLIEKLEKYYELGK